MMRQRPVKECRGSEASEEMDKNMKIATLVFALITVASTVFAQNSVGLDVGNDEELSRKIVNKVGPLITQEMVNRLAKQCALRQCDTGAPYTPPSRTERPDILVTITCMRDFCVSSLEYWPVRNLGLHAALDSCIAAGSETELTQKIFEDFVQNTSEGRLAGASRRFKMQLNEAISAFPKGVK
jgi:hypothetical protein